MNYSKIVKYIDNIRGSMHLTEDQRGKLVARDSIDPAVRRDNEFAVRNRLKEFLEFLPDANLILDILPADQLRKSTKLTDVLTNENIIGLLTLAGKLADMQLQAAAPEPVRGVAIASMHLTEKLIKLTEPAEYEYADKEHPEKGPAVTRRDFKIKLTDSLPGLADTTAFLNVSYEPMPDEIKFINNVWGHLHQIKRAVEEANRDPNYHTPDEFNKNILPKLKSQKNFKTKTTGIIGTPVRDITEDESIKQFKQADDTISSQAK